MLGACDLVLTNEATVVHDVLYIYRSSGSDDLELRYSLRSLAASQVAPRKVWIFGDRPAWLADDRALVEHVPHESTARLFRFKLPVVNGFLLTFLASLIPDLAFEFFWFADDYILLEPVTAEDLSQLRVLEDLAQLKTRGRGMYKDALWRTHDTLKRLGYGSLNFECHVPQPYTRKRHLERLLRPAGFRHRGPLLRPAVHLAVFNHAVKHEGLERTSSGCTEEGRFAGCYKTPPDAGRSPRKMLRQGVPELRRSAWGPGLEQFLAERFAEPSPYEK